MADLLKAHVVLSANLGKVRDSESKTERFIDTTKVDSFLAFGFLRIDWKFLIHNSDA